MMRELIMMATTTMPLSIKPLFNLISIREEPFILCNFYIYVLDIYVAPHMCLVTILLTRGEARH